MAVTWGTNDTEDNPDICDCGVTQALDAAADDVESSLRCLVLWVLPAAALGLASIVWLIIRAIGG